MSPVRRKSIRGQLALALWGSALLAFVLAGAGLALYQRFTLDDRARLMMEPYVRLVAVGTDAAVAFENAERAQEILDTLRANPHILEADIFLGGGRHLAGFSRLPRARPPPAPARPDGVYLGPAAAELLQELPRDARLRLVAGLGPLGEQTRSALWLFGACVLALLTVTLVQLALLGRTIVRPISSLTEAAELVRSQADYRHRVPAAGTDEVARLGHSFNAMMEAIRDREGELRRVTDFQRAILEGAAYGIISATTEGLVTSFNPAAEQMLGYRADEVVGRRTPELWHDPEEVGQRARLLSGELGAPIAPGFEVFVARPRRGLPEEHEWTFVRKDGTRLPVLLSVTALRDEGGEITGFVGLVNDLTERRRAQEEIVKLNRELEQRVVERTAQLEAANRELEAFAYSVSHDLRAPLRHIHGFLGLLEKKTALDEDGRHYMATISGAALRMGTLIDDLLAFSRMGRVEMARSPVDLGTLVREAVLELGPEFQGREVDWRIADLPVVTGDRAMLRQALLNLLSNASKFTRPRPRAEIEVGCLPDTAAEHVLFVRDNGVGFDMAYAGKLFGVFQRLHRTEDFDGTGVGLANVRRIIARHGGRTWAEGQVDQGATFYFSLPKGSVARPG